jgi:hypothetical protein
MEDPGYIGITLVGMEGTHNNMRWLFLRKGHNVHAKPGPLMFMYGLHA